MSASVVKAAQLGQFDELRELVNKDPKLVHETDEYGDTALHHAAAQALNKLTDFLLRKGANPNAQNKTGSTALHKAVVFKPENPGQTRAQLTVISELLKHGADANLKNNNELLPEDLTQKPKLRVALLGKAAVTVEVRVPKNRHGAVIGPKGKSLEDIREETFTNIIVPTAEEASENIVITGRKESVETAKEKVLKLVAEAEERDAARHREREQKEKEKQDKAKQEGEERKKREAGWTTANLTIAKDRHGLIVGKSGSTIKELSESGVKITIPHRDAADSIVKVYGPIDAVDAAVRKILEITTPRKPDQTKRNNYGFNSAPRTDANGSGRQYRAPKAADVTNGDADGAPAAASSDAPAGSSSSAEGDAKPAPKGKGKGGAPRAAGSAEAGAGANGKKP